MTLKIIAGEYRGRVLRSVKGFMTRPLLGQVREALFNILGDRVAGAEVWDLFAGTGASGLEALSRGARRVLFFEKGRQPIEVLRENLAMLGPDAKRRAHVIRGDAWDPIPPTPEGEEVEVAPDLIFLDPPYQQVGEDPSRSAWRAQKLAERLAPDGVLCFHFQEGHLDADDFDGAVELRRWGRSVIAFLPAPEGSGVADLAGPDERLLGPGEPGAEDEDEEAPAGGEDPDPDDFDPDDVEDLDLAEPDVDEF
jgi:16S rRNA (guanine966-N2)-methyltransferase